MSSSSVSTLCGSTLKRGTSGSSNFLHWLGHCFQTKRALVKFLYPASYSKVFRFTNFPKFRSMCRVLVLQDLREQRSLLLGNSPYQSVQRPLSRPEGSKKSTIVMFMVQQHILIARVCTVGSQGFWFWFSCKELDLRSNLPDSKLSFGGSEVWSATKRIRHPSLQAP